jgi:hypothetical protein
MSAVEVRESDGSLTKLFLGHYRHPATKLTTMNRSWQRKHLELFPEKNPELLQQFKDEAERRAAR